MKHNYLDNKPLCEAREEYFSFLANKGLEEKFETINTAKSFNRVSAKSHYAKICSPHYNASAMDGIAVKARDTYGADERNPRVLLPNEYTAVDTGDSIPKDKDSVIMIENVVFDDDGNVTIYSPVKPFENIRQIGEDICMGDMIIPSYTKITPTLAGALLAGGNTNALVLKEPVFGIIPTGDEIVAPTDNPKEGEIIEYNSVVFSSMLLSFGAKSITYKIVKDKKELLKQALEKAVKECDAVLIIAGSSAGRDDYTKDIIASLGKVFVHGIAIKPGKPAVLGEIENKPVIGLPGYPVSGIVIMNEIVKPLIDRYYHKGCVNKKTVRARLSKKIVSSLKYEELVRVHISKIQGEYVAVPINAGAGVITSFTKAQGILRVNQNCEGIEAGETVTVELLCEEEEIDGILSVTGSHDPIIDEIADIMKQKNMGIKIVSSHVGSMGAIAAVRNRTAFLGGIHLLCENGEYNTEYVNKYFPNGEAVIVKGVKRIQGLMVQKGNPLGIKDFSDITKGRYINRQGGSGTRILCEYLVKKHGLDKNNIEGYFNEEFTHTAVAAGIKNGNGDMGLGIYCAAKMYDLDFIPICNEEYDFLISSQALEKEEIKIFLQILKSEELKKALEKLGGYEI